MQAQQGSQWRQEGRGGEAHKAHTLIDIHSGIGLRASASFRVFTVLPKPVPPLRRESADVLCAV